MILLLIFDQRLNMNESVHINIFVNIVEEILVHNVMKSCYYLIYSTAYYLGGYRSEDSIRSV